MASTLTQPCPMTTVLSICYTARVCPSTAWPHSTLTNYAKRKMPLYEYQCRSCGKDFEVLTTSIKHQEKVLCPHCGANEVRKQLSVSSSLRSSGAQPGAAACQPRAGFS